MTEKHTILGGKVHVYKRPESPIWQCSAYLEGRNRRVSTKESSLSKAKDFAEDWYQKRFTLSGTVGEPLVQNDRFNWGSPVAKVRVDVKVW